MQISKSHSIVILRSLSPVITDSLFLAQKSAANLSLF